MNKVIEQFFAAYCTLDMVFPYTEDIPAEMIASPLRDDGWFEWQPIKGTLAREDYMELEHKYNVRFPESFIEWHRAYYFLNGDCGVLRLPMSLPNAPLQEIIDGLNHDVANEFIAQGLIPFGGDNNDIGYLVFDTRMEITSKDFPIRIYDHEYVGDLNGLNEIIFSSFIKLLECVTHYLQETQRRNHWEVIQDFLSIDPDGAGSEGRHYWLGMAERYKEFS